VWRICQETAVVTRDPVQGVGLVHHGLCPQGQNGFGVRQVRLVKLVQHDELECVDVRLQVELSNRKPRSINGFDPFWVVGLVLIVLILPLA
jgi:hypothetical protein